VPIASPSWPARSWIRPRSQAARPGPARPGGAVGGQLLGPLGAGQRAFGLSRLEGRLPGVDEPAGLAHRVRRQLGGPLEGGRGGREPAVPAGPARRGVQLAGDHPVGAEAGRGPVPGAAVDAVHPGQPAGQCQVGVPPLAERRRADHRRTDQRMPEPQPVGPDADELRPLELVQLVRQAEFARRGPYVVPAVALGARRHQEQLLRLG
jgi:hypothetical protein